MTTYDQIGVRYPWEGGKCPVDGRTKVKVWFGKDVQENIQDCGEAKTWRWGNVAPDFDIIAFEIVKFAK